MSYRWHLAPGPHQPSPIRHRASFQRPWPGTQGRVTPVPFTQQRKHQGRQ